MPATIYLLFAGDNYYPSGGMDDVVAVFYSVDDAKDFVLDEQYDWWHLACVHGNDVTVILDNRGSQPYRPYKLADGSNGRI